MTSASALYRARCRSADARLRDRTRAKQGGYYSVARTNIINAHADLRAALDMLVKAAGQTVTG